MIPNEQTRPLKKRILVVDDSKTVLLMAKGELESAGYEVLISDEPSTFMRTLRSEALDLVMVDVSMPVIGGEALVGIALRNRLGSCPIVLYSGKDAAELEGLVRLCGADGFLRKGTHGAELFKAVEGFLNAPPRTELPHTYVTPLPTRR